MALYEKTKGKAYTGGWGSERLL